MKVALCNPTDWPEVRRGAERFTRELARGLTGRGHAVRIVTSHPRAPSTTEEDGITVVRNWRPPDGRLRRRLFEDHLTTMPFTYATVRRGDDDVVQAMHPTDALAAARAGRPTVLAYMGIPHRAAIANRRARLAILERAAAEARAVTALSEHARDAFARHLGVHAHVIAPPVDTARFTPATERTERPTVMCAADPAEPRKRVDLLREAMREVPEADLWLDRRGAPDGIDMTDLPGLYGRAWVSVLPSWGEAFGLVLAEALACGTPVVGANLHGIPEVLGPDHDGIGRLFDGDDPHALANAIREAIELARDPATRERTRARAERFSVECCAEAHERLYAEILG